MKRLVVLTLLVLVAFIGCGKTETATTDTAVTETIAPADSVEGPETLEGQPSASPVPEMEDSDTTTPAEGPG